MRFVQALHWLRDLLPADQDRILKRLQAIVSDPAYGAAIRQDLAQESALCLPGYRTLSEA
jgi:hypothetical protein